MSETNEEQTEPTTEVEETEDEGGTFDAEYVRGLREEAAGNRVRATDAEKRSEAALSRLRDVSVQAAVRDVLQDPSDLPWSDDFNDEDGLPDAEKITAAAEELVTRKPHLSKVRGEIFQGYRSTESTSVDLAGMLRAGA